MNRPLELAAALVLAAAVLAGCSKKENAPMAQTTTETPAPTGSSIVSPRQTTWDRNEIPDPAPSVTPRYRLNEITFNAGGTSFGAEGSGVCRDAAGVIQERGIKKILLLAYNHKSEDGNSDLPMARCRATRDGLVRHGLSADMMEMASFGSRFSVADKLQPQAMEQERRVEIWVLAE